MAAKRFASAKVNWKAILERFPAEDESQVAKLMKLKKNHESYVRRLVALPEKAPAIDWSAYKSKVNPAFVDAIKQKYEAIQVPYPKSNVDGDIDAKEKEVAAAVAKIKEEDKATIQKLQSEIGEFDGRMSLKQMTLQEAKQAYPDLGPSVTHPTPWPHDDLEVNKEWRTYLAAKEKGLPAERPEG